MLNARPRLALLVLLTAGAASAATHQVAVGPGQIFNPATLTIAVGDTVRWTRLGGNHNVAADDGAFLSPAPTSGWQVFELPFNSEGTIGYHCDPHGGPGFGMFGTIHVTGGGGGAPGSLRFADGSVSVNEGAGTVSLTVRRTGGSSGAVAVGYTTSNGGATASGDFTAASGTLTWANGDAANKSITIDIEDDGNDESDESFSVALIDPSGGATLGSPAGATVTIVDDDTICVPALCVPASDTLCLAGGSGTPNRFRVRVAWTDFEGDTGSGVALPYTADSGFFYFFAPETLEVLVKISNGCGYNDRYWFFNAAASNVRMVYTVEDLERCATRTIVNPLGTFASDGDIDFFATCP